MKEPLFSCTYVQGCPLCLLSQRLWSQRSNAVTANAFSKSLLSKWLCASGTENSSSARWIVSNHETGRSVEPHQRISGTLWSDSSVWLPIATTFSYLTIVWTLEAAVTLYFVCVFGCYHICAGANGCGGTIREPPSCPRISKNTVFIKVYKNIPPVSCTQNYPFLQYIYRCAYV